MAGRAAPSAEEVERLQFSMPADSSLEAWAATIAALRQTQDDLAAAVSEGTQDLERIRYHLIHDAYHLGRITQLRAMQGTAPKF